MSYFGLLSAHANRWFPLGINKNVSISLETADKGFKLKHRHRAKMNFSEDMTGQKFMSVGFLWPSNCVKKILHHNKSRHNNNNHNHHNNNDNNNNLFLKYVLLSYNLDN